MQRKDHSINEAKNKNKQKEKVITLKTKSFSLVYIS